MEEARQVGAQDKTAQRAVPAPGGPAREKRGGAALAVCLLFIFLALAGSAAAAGPVGREAQALATAGLVEPVRMEPGLVLDIRYATPDNFTGQPVYPSARCYLRAEVAQRLVKAHRALKRQGLGLKVYDCYRPFSVQERFWAIMPDERYVLEPKRENGVIVKSSRHNKGAAVDVTLVDATGRELPMPTGYDDFTDKAHRDSKSATAEQRTNSLLLEKIMAAEGFEPLPTEWWHFDGPGWAKYPPLDLPLPAAQ